MATRQTQPYRSGKPRAKTAALSAMKRGKPAYMPHPLDAQRKLKRRRRRLSHILKARP